MLTQREIQDYEAVGAAWNELARLLAKVNASRPARPDPRSQFTTDLAEISRAAMGMTDTVVHAREELLALAAEDLLSGMQCLRGMTRAASIVCEAGGPPYIDPAPMSLARSIWELSARLVWSFGSVLTVEHRLARFLGSAEQHAVHIDRLAVDDAPPRESEGLRQLLRQWASDARLSTRKFQATNDGGRVLPGGERGYRFLSGFTHGTPLVVGLGMRRRDAGAETATSWVGFPTTTHVQTALYAVDSTSAATAALTRYWGGDAMPDAFASVRNVLLETQASE